jgi:amino acid permease
VPDAAFTALIEPHLKFGQTIKLFGHNLQTIPVAVVVVVVVVAAAVVATMMIILCEVQTVLLHYSTFLKSFSSKYTTLSIHITIYN